MQRRQTTAFIARDPDSKLVSLVPRVRVLNSNGGYDETDGTARAPQLFKLSQLAFDQRPTVTVAGEERLIDYHLIGPYDAQIATGDYWMEGTTKYEVVGFTEGFGYETKAQVIRHVPRTAVP
jgi:hypothetical protein